MGTEDIYDGYVSRYLNRRLSDPVSRLLAKTPLTPNQASWVALAIAALAFVSFVLGQNIIAGILVQLSSIADGVDGSLARLKGMASDFGGFLDAVLDRYADAFILLGLTLWSVSDETHVGTWVAGVVAITGTLSVSYTRARVSPAQRHLFDSGLQSVASRDIRLLLIAVAAILGQAHFCLIAIAALTNATVFYRLARTHWYQKPAGVSDTVPADGRPARYDAGSV